MGLTNNSQEKRLYMSNRDLLIIAVLSGIGGVMSSYVSYLGNLLNKVLGVPFGAGQFVAGLHVFWIILAAGLVRKPGAGVAAGLLKGVIEFLAGSTHGIAIILVSLGQGIVVDLILLAFRRYSLPGLIVAGGVAAASNVIVFQLLYFSGAPVVYIAFIAGLAFISGVLLAGSFGYSVLNIVMQARPFRMSSYDQIASPPQSKAIIWFTGLLFLILAGGAVYYYAAVYEPPWSGPECSIAGSVEKEMVFKLSDFSQHETTIKAELKGEYTYVEEQEYTGVPVKVILEQAGPLSNAARLTVTATDGYNVEFSLAEVLKDEKMLLIEEEDTLRLIAGNYEGGYWVKQVSRMLVE